MVEQAKKDEVKAEKKVTSDINYHALPGGNPFPKEVAVIETHPGFGVGSKDKYQVYIPIPFIEGKDHKAEDEFCQKYWGCDFRTYLEGCNPSTRPAYKDIFNPDGSLPANGHRQLQDLADGYKIGRTSSGIPQKVKVQLGSKYQSLMDKYNKTEEEIEAMIEAKVAELEKAKK